MYCSEPKRAIYAGTFDPPTNGHLWVISEISQLFEELVVAIGTNPDKTFAYSLQERIEMLECITQEYPNTTIKTFENMYLVEFAHQLRAKYIIRGIRSASDYEYERNMRYINSDIHPDISTLFVFPPREYSEVSSTLVKGLVGFENWENIIKRYVPESVCQIMIKKFNSNENH
ncbi:MAG: pantetheine-phosphate adenylyltransferase [Neisseriaceae bacterium]|nr:MAG: pantetheine-phosphate adenylyltransferase [Neisseriaceae bacterium]